MQDASPRTAALPPPVLGCLASQTLPAPEWGTNSPLGRKTLLQKVFSELPVRRVVVKINLGYIGGQFFECSQTFSTIARSHNTLSTEKNLRQRSWTFCEPYSGLSRPRSLSTSSPTARDSRFQWVSPT